MLKKKSLIPIIAIVLGLAIAIYLPNLTSTYMTRVLNNTMITYIIVLSLYVLFGMCGQSSFAQCGLFGVGAYITANISTKYGLPPIVGMTGGIVGTALLAYILGLALFRLKRFYFAFSTISVMMILNGLFANWVWGTGGSMGMGGLKPFSVGSFVFESEPQYFYLILGFSLLATFVVWKLFRSPLGRSFMAIRDNETAANCMGINSLLTKDTAFAISGALCGVAGSLFAFLTGYISATSFTLSQSQLYLVMVMLGGSSSPLGAAIGSFLINLLPEWFRFMQTYMILIYGVGIMVLMVVLPEGLVGGGKDLYDKFIQRKQRKQSSINASKGM
jgi:ABC-type branched-chain amino acid transport system, permease component